MINALGNYAAVYGSGLWGVVLTSRWPLRHAALSDNFRQMSQKRTVSAGEMYSPTSVEWAVDHFGLVLRKSIHLLHSVNIILFTVLLVHLILRISPHHSHHLRSHHPSLPLPSTPDLKLFSFTNPFLHSHSYSFRTDVTDLNLYRIKGALLCLF